MEYLPAIGSSLLVHGPVYVAMVVGIVLAIARWDRHPRASMFASVAFVGLILLNVAGTTVGVTLPLSMIHRGASASEVGVYMAAFSVGSSILQSLCWGLLIAALYGERGAKAG